MEPWDIEFISDLFTYCEGTRVMPKAGCTRRSRRKQTSKWERLRSQFGGNMSNSTTMWFYHSKLRASANGQLPMRMSRQGTPVAFPRLTTSFVLLWLCAGQDWPPPNHPRVIAFSYVNQYAPCHQVTDTKRKPNAAKLLSSREAQQGVGRC
jgi:hypothetical protein